MGDRIQVGGLQVSTLLHDFVNNQALPGTDIPVDLFWAGLEAIVTVSYTHLIGRKSRHRFLLREIRLSLPTQPDTVIVADRTR